MRQARSRTEVSLFPFLSVLCSMIGVLMLLLLAAAGSKALYAPRAVPGEERPAAEAAELEWQQVQLALEVEGARQRMQRALAALAAARDALAAAQDAAALAEPPAAPCVSVAGSKVRIVPDPSFAVNKEPILVEVGAAGLVFHPSGDFFAIDQMQDAGSPLAARLMELAAQSERHYLLLLVRPHGAATYDALRRRLAVLPQRLEVGVEPLDSSSMLVAE